MSRKSADVGRIERERERRKDYQKNANIRTGWCPSERMYRKGRGK